MPNESLPSLTGVRGVAALWVMLFHLQFFAPVFGAGWLHDAPVLRYGWAGVDLFFALSGFILMHVHGKEFVHPSWLRTARFALLRLFRVYPLATAVLLVISAMVIVDPGFAPWFRHNNNPADFTTMAFLRTLTLSTRWFPPFTGDWNQPVWSLSAELVGYAAFPLLALVAMRLENRVLIAVIAVLALAAPLVLQPVLHARIDNDIFGFALVRMAGAFTGGVALCRLNQLTPKSFAAGQGWIADVSLVLLIGTMLTPLATFAATLCFGGLIYGLAGGRGVANAITAHPVSMFLGRVSFPLYLVHSMTLWFVFYEVSRAGLDPARRVLVLAVFVPVIIAAALALHRWVERPAQEVGRRVAQRLLANPVAPSSGRITPA